MSRRGQYSKPAYRCGHGDAEKITGSSLVGSPPWLRLRGPVAEMRTQMKIGGRKKRMHEAQKKERECTLDELNAILWPSGKHMPLNEEKK